MTKSSAVRRFERGSAVAQLCSSVGRSTWIHGYCPTECSAGRFQLSPGGCICVSRLHLAHRQALARGAAGCSHSSTAHHPASRMAEGRSVRQPGVAWLTPAPSWAVQSRRRCTKDAHLFACSPPQGGCGSPHTTGGPVSSPVRASRCVLPAACCAWRTV